MGFWNISGGRIFISYRRDDSQVITERIYDRLVTAFGKDKVFKDLSSIAPGATFADVIHDELGRCGAVLVVIGPQWTTIPHPDGTPRIAKSDDWVHMEVALALKRRGIRVIPLLVQGASLPDSRSLPPDLQSLVEHNAHPVRNDPTFDGDMERLIGALSQALQVKTQAGPRNQGPVGSGMKVATWVIGIMAVGCFGFFALGWLGSGASPTRESSIDSTAKIAIDPPESSIDSTAKIAID